MNFDKYKNDLPWVLPYKTRQEIIIRQSIIEDAFVGTKAEHEALEAKHKKEWKDAEDEVRRAYNQRETERIGLFWKDVFEDLGIPLEHPKADAFKRIAWAKGHSYGLSEVYGEACDLVALLDL